MNLLKTYFTTLMTGLIVLSLSSCASESTNRKADNTSEPVAETVNTFSVTQVDTTASAPTQAQKVTPVATKSLKSADTQSTSIAKSAKTVLVNIYQADSQCQTLVSKKVALPAESPANAAVEKVLKQVDSGDFDLVGYRVNVNAKSGVATVDLRLSPDSQRQFVSLSECEQFALFGSLRKTLIDNSQLKIKNVRFTQQGKEIKL